MAKSELGADDVVTPMPHTIVVVKSDGIKSGASSVDARPQPDGGSTRPAFALRSRYSRNFDGATQTMGARLVRKNRIPS